MFRIPNSYQETPSFNQASIIMTRLGRGNCLEGMKTMDSIWDNYCVSEESDDDSFFSIWAYEVSAYNVIYASMEKLLLVKPKSLIYNDSF